MRSPVLKAPSLKPRSLADVWPALAGLSAVFLFEMLDNSILNVALPTIGRELAASTTTLQWVTGAYSVVFGGLMLAFGALADRVGRRRIMLIGLVLLGLASFATAFVTTPWQLIAVRALMGVAAAMTTPGRTRSPSGCSSDDRLRVRAMHPDLDGRHGRPRGRPDRGRARARCRAMAGVAARQRADRGARVPRHPRRHPRRRPRRPAPRSDRRGGRRARHRDDRARAAHAHVVRGPRRSGRGQPWTAPRRPSSPRACFVVRERTARYPLLDLALVARPLVSSGLALKAATGLAIAGMGYLVTLQLQLDWGWPPAWPRSACCRRSSC